MKIRGSKTTIDLKTYMMNDIILDEEYYAAVIDWGMLNDKTRRKILRKFYGDFEFDTGVWHFCAVVVPSKNTYMNFEHVYLYIGNVVPKNKTITWAINNVEDAGGYIHELDVDMYEQVVIASVFLPKKDCTD